VTSRREGITRLVIGVLAALWAAVTLYFVGALSVAVVYAVAFAVERAPTKYNVGSGRWHSRAPVGNGTIAIVVFLAIALSNIVSSTVSDEFGFRLIGALMSFLAGFVSSIWFSSHRWERI